MYRSIHACREAHPRHSADLVLFPGKWSQGNPPKSKTRKFHLARRRTVWRGAVLTWLSVAPWQRHYQARRRNVESALVVPRDLARSRKLLANGLFVEPFALTGSWSEHQGGAPPPILGVAHVTVSPELDKFLRIVGSAEHPFLPRLFVFKESAWSPHGSSPAVIFPLPHLPFNCTTCSIYLYSSDAACAPEPDVIVLLLLSRSSTSIPPLLLPPPVELCLDVPHNKIRRKAAMEPRPLYASRCRVSGTLLWKLMPCAFF